VYPLTDQPNVIVSSLAPSTKLKFHYQLCVWFHYTCFIQSTSLTY